MRQALMIALIALLLLGACTPARPSGPLIEYHRTGGIAGFDDRLVIGADGAGQITQRSGSATFTLDRDALSRLTAALDQGGFGRLGKEYLPANTCCDLMEYTVTYQGRSVRTMDTAVPEALQPILAELNQLLSDLGRR